MVHTLRIYLDNHATTRIDPRVLDVMMPYLIENYANAGSVSHEFGRQVAEDVQAAIASIAGYIGCDAQEIIVTSGATESTNLGIFGVCQHARMKRRKIVAIATEHRAVLDPIDRLVSSGFEVDWLIVHQQGAGEAGVVDLDYAAKLIDEQTAIVCAMLVNNEMGVIQPVRQIADLARNVGAVTFCDATAGVGRMDVDVRQLGVDLMAFSAHKFHGPKGVGGLYVRADNRNLRLRSQILGGGQQRGFRSGTLNVPGIIGMRAALAICDETCHRERPRSMRLQQMFHDKLCAGLGDRIELNGPLLGDLRAPENLNYRWQGVEGQSLMLAVPEICFSSGSACSAAEQTVSHVLTAIGLDIDSARCSTRFGLGRFNTEDEIQTAAESLIAGYLGLRSQFS
jgi:cysteine desulfurase